MSDTISPARPAESEAAAAIAQSVRDAWRAAGGTIYSSPNGEIASMKERVLISFLGAFVGESQRQVIAASAVAATPHEVVLRALVGAVCPGLDTGDLLRDAETAIRAMGSAEPAGYFGLDDTLTADGDQRHLQVSRASRGDEDIFPLFRRAPLHAELSQAAADAAARKPRAPKGGAK